MKKFRKNYLYIILHIHFEIVINLYYNTKKIL